MKMAYQSAKPSRRNGSALVPRKSFTHQVFRPNMTATHLDSIEYEQPNFLEMRASHYGEDQYTLEVVGQESSLSTLPGE